MNNETQKDYPSDIAIRVWYSHDNGGYMYSLLDARQDDDDTDELDGGICTGTLADAIEMASSHAVDYFKLPMFEQARAVDVQEAEERAQEDEQNRN